MSELDKKAQLPLHLANSVIVSTWDPDSGYDLENFQLQARARGDGIFGILCEKSK